MMDKNREVFKKKNNTRLVVLTSSKLFYLFSVVIFLLFQIMVKILGKSKFFLGFYYVSR